MLIHICVCALACVCVVIYACVCVHMCMFVFTCVIRLRARARAREIIIFTETLRTQGVDKKVNQTSEIKTGNIIPKKGGKTNLQFDYQSD